MHLDTPAAENAEQHATRLTKRHLVKPFWVLLVPFLFPSALAAEPSLAETVQYIEAKISSEDTSGIHTFRLNGRNITYSYRGNSGVRGTTSTFQLGALSTTVDLDIAPAGKRSSVQISCARGACISEESFYISRKGHPTKERREEERRSAGGAKFYVLSKDAERVQKALVHAIKLSGGKDELF